MGFAISLQNEGPVWALKAGLGWAGLSWLTGPTVGLRARLRLKVASSPTMIGLR